MPGYQKIINWPALSVTILLITGLGNFASCQNQPDSLPLNPKSKESAHSPKKALILAATLPGSGQAYNRKYWKIPIVYAGYAGGVWFFVTNQTGYKNSKRDYIYETDKIDSTVNNSGKTAQVLLAEVDSYRRMRDISVLALLAWHGLTIIDANVDAHFFNWDISEDLSMKLRPHALWAGARSPGLGMSIVFNLK